MQIFIFNSSFIIHHSSFLHPRRCKIKRQTPSHVSHKIVFRINAALTKIKIIGYEKS